MTSPREKGQCTEGVHHSEVSESLFRRADEGERKEERMGGRGGGTVSYLLGYWLSAKDLSWPTELACIHCVQINHHTVCVSPSCVVFDCILIMRKLHKWSFGS